MRIGVLTGGGDCPGLNAVIRSVVRTATNHYGSEVVGFRDGWRGVLDADVVQTCVVTLESVRNQVSDHFDALFAPPHLIPDEAAEIDVELEEDFPEPLQHGRIDIGELTAQHLALALDPYPRAAGIDFEDHIEELEEAEPVRENPFASLAKIKRSH